MTLSLTVSEAIQAANKLQELLVNGTAQYVVIQRESLDLPFDSELLTSRDAELNDFLWETSMRLYRKYVVDGEVSAFKGDDSDPWKICLEELMASEVYLALHDLEDGYLQESGFWRYLGLYPFRWYLLKREGDASGGLQKHDFGGSSSSREKWLMIRTYQWGQRTHQGEEQAPFGDAIATRLTRRAAGVSSGMIIDYYHSHIVRSRWADNAKVVHAFVQCTSNKPYLVDTSVKPGKERPVNELAKQVKRVTGNLLLLGMDEGDLEELLRVQKNQILGLGSV